MRILLTGGTGLIGQALCRHWRSQGHELWVWSRDPRAPYPPSVAAPKALHSCKRLMGARHWTPWSTLRARQLPIVPGPRTAEPAVAQPCRFDTHPRRLDGPATHATARAAVGLCGGMVRRRSEQWLAEDSAPGNADFGSLCVAWEQEAERARQWGVRVALRTAPVLAPKGGMLARLVPPFRLGLGGRLGNGQQWMPWIHLDDQVALIDHLLQSDACSGPYNACASEVVRNADFTQTLARALHRPAVLPAPTWILRLALGEMSVLLLGGRLAPRRTQNGIHLALPAAIRSAGTFVAKTIADEAMTGWQPEDRPANKNAHPTGRWKAVRQ